MYISRFRKQFLSVARATPGLKRMRVRSFRCSRRKVARKKVRWREGGRSTKLVTKRGSQEAHRYVGKLGEDVLHVSRGRHDRMLDE